MPKNGLEGSQAGVSADCRKGDRVIALTRKRFYCLITLKAPCARGTKVCLGGCFLSYGYLDSHGAFNSTIVYLRGTKACNN